VTGTATRTEVQRALGRRLVLASTTIVTILLFAWFGLAAMAQRSNARSVAQELVNEHLLAAYMERLPVDSDSPVVVDRYFKVKVPYPVRTSADLGPFKLHGGGICDVSGEFAATAVYRNAHDSRISVFQFPDGELSLPSSESLGDGLSGLTRQGYSIVYWRHRGLVHVVVSDIPLGELADIARPLNLDDSA
jgi:anti-sigma factor RsiW